MPDGARLFWLGRRWVAPLIKRSKVMFSQAKKYAPADRAAIDAFFANGGTVTMCPPRRAHMQSPGGWAKRVDDRSIG